MESDEQIAAAVQAGHSDAFGELITRYEAKLTRYGRTFIQNPDAITDAVQDVFIKAYTNIQSYDTAQRFSPWIYRIAHNTFVNELRQYKKRGFSFFTFDADTLFPHLAAPETADAATLDDELRTHLDSLLHELPPKYREVVTLHYYDDLSYQEMSDVLHIPIATVGVRLTRARAQLKNLYSLQQSNHDQT